MLRRRLLQGAAALGLIPFLPRLAEANVLNVVGEATVSGKPPHLDHWFISLNSVEPIPDKLLGWKKINSVEACGLIENTLKDLKKHYGNRAVHSAKLPIPEDLPGVSAFQVQRSLGSGDSVLLRFHRLAVPSLLGHRNPEFIQRSFLTSFCSGAYYR